MDIYNRISKNYFVDFYFWEDEIEEIFKKYNYTKKEQKEMIDFFDGHRQLGGCQKEYFVEMECFIDTVNLYYEERDLQHCLEVTGYVTDKKCIYLHKKGFEFSDFDLEYPYTTFTFQNEIERIKKQID